MIKNKKICIVIGTRPEAIKLCPLISKLKEYKNIDVKVCMTGQHEKIADEILKIFSIIPSKRFHVMSKGQSLAKLTTKLIKNLDLYFKDEKFDAVIVLGDTTTALCGALAAFYNKISVAHVEAGLRTNDKLNPYPEEMNRVLISRIAKWNFCPTLANKQNLIKENIDKKSIYLVGNTVIDALYFAVSHLKTYSNSKLDKIVGIDKGFFDNKSKMILVTSHRRENHDSGIENICNAVLELSKKYENVNFLYSVHPNPNVSTVVYKILDNKNYKNIFLIKPLNYLPFIALMNKAYLILTDSGGILEEAPSLNKPVLVLRKTTERLEGTKIGMNQMIGTDTNKIIDSVSQILENSNKVKNYKNSKNPYGDGKSSEKIINILLKELS